MINAAIRIIVRRTVFISFTAWLALASCTRETSSPTAPPGMVLIPGGDFVMGTDDGLPSEGPAHPAQVAPFFLDAHEVSNRSFAEFVDTTGYVTEAEQIGWALVFDIAEGRWKQVAGANWRAPDGPGSTAADRPDHPVVQVSVADAEAYARWCGKRLPSEAEWERAARGGLSGALYPWGNELNPGGEHLANTWQGRFPNHSEPLDGFATTASVGSFPPNRYGLYDMAGNVWEWTAQPFSSYPSETRLSAAEQSSTARVIRGGSWLCSPDYCSGYRVGARQPSDVDSAQNNLGFRLAADVDATTDRPDSSTR